MSFFSDVVGVVKDTVSAVVGFLPTVAGLAFQWVYAGLTWALDLVLPRELAEKIARVTVTTAAVVGSAAMFYFGYKLLFPATVAGGFLRTVAITALSAPLGLIYGLPGKTGRAPWLKYAYGLYAVFGVYQFGAATWERAR